MKKFSISDHYSFDQIQNIIKSTDNIVSACERSYELGFHEGKLAGINKAEELFKPVEDALKNVRTVVGGSDDN